MDKINNYIPKPIPPPVIPKKPCLTPACFEKNRQYEEAIKAQQSSRPTLHNKTQYCYL